MWGIRPGVGFLGGAGRITRGGGGAGAGMGAGATTDLAGALFTVTCGALLGSAGLGTAENNQLK